MLRHLRLDEKGGLVQIDAAGDELGRSFARPGAQLSRILAHRDGVHVRDEEERVVVILGFHPVDQGSEIIS